MSLPWILRAPLLTRRAVAARDGDAAAMRALYRELHPEVARFVGRRVSNHADAEDLVARVFMVVVQRLGDFDPERGGVRAWVLTIARNAVIDHFRRSRPAVALDAVGEALPAVDDPLGELLERERLEELLEHLDRLDAEAPQTRELLVLRYADGLRHREIAALVGLSEAAVKQRLSRAIRELRGRLAAGRH
ncbi:MAG TPA: sigma-70 family RNA polymerase sigma factor, partial [Nannocystaceae bacterium]|nr:sigma-70 family RNA polymerase sigma factor [Nannocystaceae bacterium]